MLMNRNLELFKIYVVQHLGEAGLADSWVSELNYVLLHHPPPPELQQN